MYPERRVELEAIPIDLFNYINNAQFGALTSLEQKGWYLFAIRRKELTSPSVIVRNEKTNDFRELAKDGNLVSGEVRVRGSV